MSTMFQSGEFFVRLRVQGERPKLTIWNNAGTKIVSEFINSTTPSFWVQMAKLTAQEVVDDVLALLEK
ncbi:MAG TPA: hypothetical protein GX521_07850 [Firmicutes bacterium]|nr:hypothetical protein [Bacillota bacterium]